MFVHARNIGASGREPDRRAGEGLTLNLLSPLSIRPVPVRRHNERGERRRDDHRRFDP
jgi:hypothetical protein